jgi:hypothetical protein
MTQKRKIKMANKQRIDLANVANPESLCRLLNAMYTEVTALRTLTTELRTDHATFKAAVDELETWAETLGAKLNADGGVTDEDYDATITNSAPATITAAAATQQVEKGK